MTFSPVVSFTLGTLSRSSLTLLRPPRLAAPSSSASSSLGAVILTPGITPEEALPVWLLVKPRGSKIGRLSPRIRGSESPSSSPGEVILGAEEGGRGNGDDIFWTRGPSNDCLESSKWRGQEKVDLGSLMLGRHFRRTTDRGVRLLTKLARRSQVAIQLRARSGTRVFSPSI